MTLYSLCRVSNDDGCTWKEIWIKTGLFVIEKKRWGKHGYIMQPSIVKKEMED